MSSLSRLYANWQSGLAQNQLGRKPIVGSIPTSRIIKYDDVWGPYDYSDGTGRKLVIRRRNKHSNKQCVAYAKHLWEQNYGPVPVGFEVHHKNHKVSDDRLENLDIITALEHRKIHGELREPEFYYGKCPICKNDFVKLMRNVRGNHKKGKAGPFCGRRCAGIYSTNVQYK